MGTASIERPYPHPKPSWKSTIQNQGTNTCTVRSRSGLLAVHPVPKCDEVRGEKTCDFNGVMRNFVTTLSPAQETLRVPLIPCVSQRLGGEVDVCCRDPNYKDPWPEQEQAREESRALGGDEWRWSKDVRSRENAARSRSKVASNQSPPQLAANNLPPQVAAIQQTPPQVAANQPPSQVPAKQQTPSRVAANQPTSF